MMLEMITDDGRVDQRLSSQTRHQSLKHLVIAATGLSLQFEHKMLELNSDPGRVAQRVSSQTRHQSLKHLVIAAIGLCLQLEHIIVGGQTRLNYHWGTQLKQRH